MNDSGQKDWVHKEVVCALNSNCNIIPVFDNFLMPNSADLPITIRPVTSYNGVNWIHEYQNACADKIVRFLTTESTNDKSRDQSEPEAKPVPSKDLILESIPPGFQAIRSPGEGSHSEVVGAVELGVHPQILIIKEENPVPSKDPVSISAPPTPNFQSIRRPFEVGQFDKKDNNPMAVELGVNPCVLPDKEIKPVPVNRLPTEGSHSELTEKETKPVSSKEGQFDEKDNNHLAVELGVNPWVFPDKIAKPVPVIRLPSEGYHSEVTEKEVQPVPSKDLVSSGPVSPDVQSFFLSCEGSGLEAIKQAVMTELGVQPESFPGKEAKPVSSKDLAPPDFQSFRHPTEGCHSAKLQTYTSPPSNDESNIAKKLQTWPIIKSEDIPDFIQIDVSDQIESSETQKAPDGTENNESEVIKNINRCMKNIEREEPEGMANEAYVNEV